MFVRLALLTAMLCQFGALTAVRAEDPSAPDAEARTIDFARDIEPLIATRCAKCHGHGDAEGGLRLTDLASATAKRESGQPAIVAGRPELSELVRRVTADDDNLRMPPTGPRLSTDEVGRLRRWIAEGADWPSHWAYRPLVRPSIPEPAAPEFRTWCRTPVDRFIAAELERNRLSPSPGADRKTLLRRLAFNLTGLPPTPDETRSFVADESPEAWERLVDRWLGSPRHGERWARHWMDLVHYAETHGNDQDRPRENAWPYRDFLIQAFNDDRPYSLFVQQQIAGDVLFPDDPASITATGFLATGPWDESSLKDIQENTLDREIARYLDRDDIVTTVMATFVSSTVHCARCHDHKFDPISQRNYYSLQAVFAATDKANRPYDPDPHVAQRRKSLVQEIARLSDRRLNLDPTLLAPELSAEVAAWEKAMKAASSAWQALTPSSFTSEGKATLTREADGSVSSGGTRPEKDVVTLVCPTELTSLTGLRLEVLNDDRLPHKGPGRQDNGNLHLNEIVVHAASKANPDAKTRLTLRNPKADFNQQGWTIEHALDGNPGTAWGIFPEVGKSHQAVFELATPYQSAEGIVLTVELHQTHGGGHLIGRARLSVTQAPAPFPSEAEPLPPRIASYLAIPLEQRGEDQKIDLAAYYLDRKLKKALEDLPKPQFVYAGTNQFEAIGSFRPASVPREIRLLKRGEITKPGDVMEPGALGCLPDVPFPLTSENMANEGQRRVALSRWVSDTRNALVWRSIANRVWQYHFGRGLVDTPSDFGRMGSPPTHPELLDWLACELRDNGGSLKSLHRILLSSAAYQQSSNPADRNQAGMALLDPGASPRVLDPVAVDGDNRLLWRMNRQRLDAEALRDAALVASGSIDDRMGGPSVRQFLQTPGIHVTPNVDYAGFSADDPANFRRSVYRFVFRTIPDPFMDALDCPDSSQLTPRRSTSVTALQALALWNDKVMVRQSERLADAVAAAGDDPQARLDELCLRLLCRLPTERERAAIPAYAAKHGWSNACRVLMNSNEFLFVD